MGLGRITGRRDVDFTLSSCKIDRRLVYGDTNIFDGVDVSYVLFRTSLKLFGLDVIYGVGSFINGLFR